MNKRSILILCILALILISFSLGTAQKSAVMPKKEVTPLPADKIVSITPPVGAKDECYLYHTDWVPMYYHGDWKVGDKVAIYFDPEDCGYPVNYPFQLTDVEFLLYDFEVVGSVDVRFSVEVMCPDICDGPGIEIYKSPIYPITIFYPDPVTIYFPDTICLDKPFFFNLEYMSGDSGTIPSVLFDAQVVDTCYQWGWTGQPAWYEWYDFWPYPPPGWAVLGISGYVADQADCGWWYWKPDTTEAPSGMPDFDQNQFGPPDSQAMCGPTAVANCLWWFDAVPPGLEDPGDFIRLLSDYFNTDPGFGTYVDSIQAGLDRYFEDFGFALKETTYWMPDFYEMEDSLKVCQDIILLLGFWWWDDYYEEWYREGGHFVTMAGVNSEKKEIAISDPDRDQCVQYPWWPGRVRTADHLPWGAYGPSYHNNTQYVSHDVYISLLYPEFPSPGSDVWDLADYCYEGYKYFNKNVPERFRAFTKQAPKHLEYWHTEVEAAIMICPVREESLYWKPSYEDYAPNGMPDIDQKQDNWFKVGTGNFTFCGPVAVANCFKWFDSKYNRPPGFPGDGNDQFPLVRDYMDNLGPFTGIWDDHDPWNVDHAGTPWGPPANPPPATAQPFVPGAQPQPSTMPAWGELVERLAWYFNTDGIQTGYCDFSGTNVYDMQDGIEQWFLSEEFEDGSTLADTLYEYTIPMPTFTEVETLVEMCEDVILLLGFWWFDDVNMEWFRCGGHYVTVAGINSEEFLIAISDPMFDNAEIGGPGRVGNGTLIPHAIPHTDATVHNDEGNVSHDIYSVSTDPASPGGLWELVGYPVSLNPGYCYDFYNQNVPLEFEDQTAMYQTGPLFTEVEYAVVISPRNHPPVIGQPDFLEGFVDDTVEYEITGTDPNGDVIDDSASITIIPGCGTYSITRTSGHGTSTGTWQVTWYTDTCAVCDTHMVIHDLVDEHGAVGYCTTWVHLSSERECDPNDPYDCDTLWVECGNMLVPPGGGLVTIDLTIANDESLKTFQVVLSYAGSPTCCDSMPDSENTVAQVFAGSVVPGSWIKAISIDHQAKTVMLGATQIVPDCLPPGKGHLATLTLFGDSCCTIELDTITVGGITTGFIECYDPTNTWFYPVCRIDTCHIERNNPPVIEQPDFLEGYVDDVVEYTITGTDPDGDIIRDSASIDIQPGCGSYSITRTAGHGTHTGTWQVSWQTDGCTPCDTHLVIHDLTDVLGATAYCTTWVHLSQPESLYWKPPYEDYAPNGMPDIYQKQDGWYKYDTGWWTFCGPCAVANCFKWFDSKYNVPPGGPGDGNDQFPLVRDYMDNLPPYIPPALDDHDPWNVDHTGTPWNPGIGPPPATAQPFVPGPQPQPSTMPPWGELVERLAWYFNTDGIQTGYCEFSGTNIMQMQQGIDRWFESEIFEDSSTIADTLYERTWQQPTFAWVETLVEKCQDVILLLGFWYQDPSSGEWFRIGGHYVTVAGVNSETYRIAFSDPFIDNAEFGAPGRVGNGTLIPHSFPHDPTVHNDEGNVSHDIYTADTASISPGGDWWLPDYAINGDPGYWSSNFYAQNIPDEFIDVTAPWDGVSEIFTEVEYAIEISPWEYPPDCGDANGDGTVNIADAIYLVNWLFIPGNPPPVKMVKADVNHDGAVNIADVVYLINWLFLNGAPPQCYDP